MLKKLTGKNSRDYEFVARHVMDNTDVELFRQLVEKDSFLFDFVKENVSQRLQKATNEKNWRTVVKFLKYYSPSYEDFICSTLAQYADEKASAFDAAAKNCVDDIIIADEARAKVQAVLEVMAGKRFTKRLPKKHSNMPF